MSKSAQRQKERRVTAEEPAAQPEDRRNAKLDDEVNCCLADIDTALDEVAKADEAGRADAIKEWKKLRPDTYEDIEAFNTRYGHLSLVAGYSCCMGCFLEDSATGEIVGSDG